MFTSNLFSYSLSTYVVQIGSSLLIREWVIKISFFSQMSVSQKPNWLELPDLVFDKVMLMIGLSCLEALDRCRQVCTTWKLTLLRKLWENPRKSWGIVIRRRIEKSWGLISTLPSVEDVEIVPLGTLLLSIGKLSR